jgi:hypothetical protein
MSGKSLMNGSGESYCGIVPTKQPNKSDGSIGEYMASNVADKPSNTRSVSLRMDVTDGWQAHAPPATHS